jgi:hypothetical protein
MIERVEVRRDDGEETKIDGGLKYEEVREL